MKSAPDIIKKALPNSPSPGGRMFRMLLSCLIGLLVLSSQALGQSAILEFAPVTVTVDPNTNTNTVFSVDVQVNGSGQFDAVEAYLTFDPAVLQITNETLPASGLTVFSNVENNTLGTYEFAGVSLGPNLATGVTIVTLEFTVIGTTSPTGVDFNGASPINPSILTSVQLDGTDVLVGTTPLSVTINSNNTAPVVNITTPTDGATVTRGSNIAFEATVTDTEEPGLGSSLSWTSSDVAFSGSQAGLSITDQLLEPGPQTITASITDGGGLEGTDEITVNVSCPQVSFVSPTDGGNVSGTSVAVEVSAIDVLFGTEQNANEHFHFFINPPDLNNLNQDKRISTATNGPQTSFTFDENSGSLAFDGNGNGIVVGVNTIVVVAAQANHTEFTCTGAKAIVNFTVADANTVPVITLDATASVTEGGSITVPLSITDGDGDALTVDITTVSNEPQDLQSGNSGTQVDPYPTTAAGFFNEGGIGSAAGTYSSSLTFTPTFGDGGSNGDGSAVYTVTVSVSDEDGNTITQDLDVTVNDTDQVVSGSTTKIEAESFDEQGPDNTTGTSDSKGIGVEIDPGGFINIGFTNVNDFAEYEIDVQTAGTYQLDLFVGVPGAVGVPTDKVMDISSNGNVVGTFTANGTATGNAGFGTYVTQSLQIALPAGPQTLRFDWVGGTGFLFNIDYFELSPVANLAPVFDLVISDQTNLEGDVISLDGSATDPETDNITYGATGLPAGLGISTTTGEISGTIAVGAAANSPYAVTVTATDDGSPIASATQSFQWTVTTVAVNNPPVIVGASDVELDEGETLQLGLQVNDDTDPSATIAIFDKSVPGGTNNPFTPNPSGEVPASDYTFTESSPGSGSYQLLWTPGVGDGRSYVARVTADDGVNTPVVEAFNIDVAQTVPGIILARTYTNPQEPWYGNNPPVGNVSIEAAGNIGYVNPGDFTEYLIDVPAAGVYDLRVNASKGNNTGGNPATLTISEESGGGFSPIGTVSVPNNGWTNFADQTTTVTFASAGLQTLRFDFGGGMNITEFEFTSPTGTQIPVFTAEIPNQINLEGDTPTGLAVAAIDPDGGAAVTFSDNGTLPPGLSIDPNTGAISGTISAGAAANSPYAVVITATDDETEINTSSFSWTVTVPATFPICVNCGDLPGPITAFGRSFGADQYLTSASSNFNKTAGTAIAGVITGSGEHTLFRSEKYNDPLTYAIPTGNGEFTIELYFSELFIGSAGGGSGLGAGDRLFDIDVEGSTETGIDLFTEYGPLVAATKTFTVTVTDGFLNIDLDATEDNAKLNGFCITETSNFVANAAPTISIEPVTDLLDCEGDGEDITLTANANDTEQGDMDAIIIWKDGNGTQVGTGATLALTAATGIATYTAEVTDATPATTIESVTVTVVANTSPILSAITANPTTITAGSSVSLSVSQADDAEDGVLAVSWTSDIEPAGALGTGPSITPTLSEVGEHTITATITDACGVSTTQTTTVQVDAVSNADPVLTIVSPIDNIILLDCEADGELVNLEATVTDAEDDDTVLAGTISWTLGVEGASLGTGATVNGVSLAIGTNELVATVTDSDNNTVSQSVTVEVIGNTAPFISDLTAAPTTIFVGAAVALTAIVTDAEDDDNTLVVNWSSSLETANSGELGSGLTLNPILTVEGEHTITASVTDACGQETTETLTVTVIPVEVCAISAITVTNISACNPADDTFTADVTVEFSTAPTTGTLDLSIDGTASIDVSTLQGDSHTFTAVEMAADGSAIILKAEFSDESACSLTNIDAGSAPEACSVAPACAITSLSLFLQGTETCDDNGTADPSDDFFFALVFIDINNAPTTGTLDVTGDGTGSISVNNLGPDAFTSEGTNVGFAVAIDADGGPITLTATFSDDPTCTFTGENLGTALLPCSVPDCAISDIAVTNISACNDQTTTDLGDDTFTADVTVTFADIPTTGALDLTGDGTGSIDVTSIVGTTHTFTGVEMSADGGPISLTATFSDDTACTITNEDLGTAPEACSIVPCSISELSVDNISACNNNGTIETTDDTFTADVTVNFAGAPVTGTLELLGDGTASVDVSTLTGSTYTFVGVSMPADGGAISLTAFFSEDELCTTLAINLGTAPVSCSETVCEISDIAVANISACSDAGTDVLTDDTFTADVTITFINAPATGTLDLTGDGTASVDVTTLVGTSHIFTGVIMPADGAAISLTAAFSADGACSLDNTDAGTAPEACSITADPCARVAFDTGGGLAGSSTFGGGLFITNNSVGNVNISSVSIDLGTAVLPNVVFDPVGTAGDATAQCVTLIAQTGGNSNVGLTIPGNNGSGTDPDCVTPFSVPNGPGGYEVMTLEFTEFEPGETVNIAVDVDPRSIEGFNAAGNAGAIAGTELIGSTVTVTYSDGSTATRQLYQVGNSLVNSENFFSPATPQCAAPSLEIGGVTGNGTITDVSQTATITGPANANLEILVYGMTLEDLGPNGAPADPFEMNKTQSLLTTTATIGGTGTVDVPLNLSGTSDQQIYYIIATIIPEADDCGPGACDISNVVRLEIVEPVCELTALTVDNISACDDSGSADLADDTFTADVTVTFVDAPATGTLDLTGDGVASVDASTLVGETSYTFIGVSMIADGGDISLTATFSADGVCSIENLTAGTAPEACSTDPCARVAFDTGGGLAGSSTFGGGLFITNNSTGNINISSVTIDLGTAVLPNVVFDPVGTAGDATAQCVTLITQTGGNGNVGLTIPGNNGSGTDPDCVDPFSVPNGPGGYEVMTLDFTEFEPGETVNIAVDVDPRSIEGFNAAGNAGAIAGSELIGSTVTVTYSDGSTATRQLYQVGSSLVNSENFFSPATPQCAAPSLEIGGVTGNGTITDVSQTATITGPANANLEILVYGMTLEDLGPNGAPADPFEMNKTQSLLTTTATIGGTGTVDVPLNLSGTSDQQIYYIIATIIPEADDCGPGACDISNVVRLQIVEPVCELTALTVDNISACNDESTPDLGDDTFTADVTVTFANPPATGTLDLSGDGTASVDASTLAGETSYTFVGVSMSADGGAISLTAAFSADGACSIDNADAGTAPEACSVQPCELNALTVANISACNDESTPDLGDDTFTADITVTFANPPAAGTLDLSGDGTASVDASTLAGETSYTFVGVSMSADGGAISLTAAFSADGACSIDNADAGTAPEACSVQPCELNALTVANISACNDESTPDLGDDTFTADVTVTFANPPATGTLDLSGDGTGTVDASTLAGETSYTFVGVSMSADGGAISLTAAFSADGACSIDNADAGTAPEACSVPPAPVSFWLEAECAVVGSNWNTVTDGDASNGEYVTIENGNNSLGSPPADIPANQVEFTVELTADQAADFHLFARINAPGGNDDSFWVRVNGGGWIQWWQGLTTTSGFTWREVLNSPFAFTTGTNTIEFAYREDGTLLDKIYVSTDSALPTTIGPEGVNCVPNVAPIAAFTADPLTGTAPLTVSFDASGSSDADGTIVSYAWDFDGATATETSPLTSFTFDTPGTYVVSLVVTDNDGATSTNVAQVTIVVDEVPDADQDGVADADDNCPNTPNADQADLDNDGTGDLCDTDADGDGFDNTVDCDDLNAAINPGATDIPDNGIDEDCDGEDATTSGTATFWLEAECAVVGSNWTTVSDTDASNGEYVTPQNGFNSLSSPPADVPANQIGFTVNLSASEVGDYYLFARIEAPSSNDNSFWVRINGGNWIQWWQGLDTQNGFEWKEVLNSPFGLVEGNNTVEFAYREDGTLLDKIYLSGSSAGPSAIGPEGTNCTASNELPIASFFATPLTGNAPLNVSLNASASSDSDGNIVTYSWQVDGPVAAAFTETTPLTSFLFDIAGIYTVTLTVIDNDGGVSTNTATATIVVSPQEEPDADEDGIPDATDNCVNTPNPDQADLDNDGIGDVCDADADGDGFNAGLDCNDFDAAINPEAIDIPDNGIDENCDGQDATTSEDATFWLEAECAEVGANWDTTVDPSSGASNDAYVSIQSGLNSLFVPPSANPANIVKFTVNLTPAQVGSYYLLARVQAPTSSDDSFWVRVNGGSWIQWWQNLATGNSFQWREVAQSPFNLTAGDNTIEFAYREDGTLLDKIVVSSELQFPNGVGGTAPACDISTNQPPVASFFATPLSGTAPLTVDFDASASTDPDGNVIIYNWDFGPVTGADNNPQISYTFTEPGTYLVSLVVTDNEGATSTNTATATIVVNPANEQDTDQDGVPDSEDNCPTTPNPNQADLDNDGIGNLCDTDADGDGFDESIDCDDFNPDVNNGAVEICDGIDNDCDGLTDEDGVCDGCNTQLISFNNFDNSWGIWNDGGSDCRRSLNDAEFAFGGTGRPVRLRDNSSTSVMTTDDLNLTAYSELTVAFTYLPISMDSEAEDFFLEISTDGGNSFSTIEEWNEGDEFENGIRYFEEVTINGSFTTETQLRFRCDASGNSDWVYIDNVEISGCFSPAGLIETVQPTAKTAKEEIVQPGTITVQEELPAAVTTELQLFPNPVQDELTVKFGVTKLSDVTLIITDLQGQRVKQQRMDGMEGTVETSLMVDRLPAGIYLLHVITPTGRQTEKFVVSKQ